MYVHEKQLGKMIIHKQLIAQSFAEKIIIEDLLVNFCFATRTLENKKSKQMHLDLQKFSWRCLSQGLYHVVLGNDMIIPAVIFGKYSTIFLINKGF